MKTNRTLLLLFIVFAVFQTAFAQGNTPVAVVMKADGPVMPPMLEYIKRGIETANRRNAEVVVIELNTPGGNIETMLEIISEIRSSNVPVVVYVTPRNAIAGSAGAMITLSGHASAMAPETSIGASSPISSSGENLSSTADKKAKEIIKASIRPYVTPRGDEALKLAESMIDDAKAVTADEALAVNLIDFISKDVNELLQSLDGFTVQMDDGPRTLHTKDIKVQSLNISFIEQLLILMTNPNISFLLLAIGVQAILIELASPGGWVAGFIGVVCLTLSIYGLGLLSVNLFGIIFLVTAFVLFVLDIKAPTHGALTTAGVASFIVGGLVLFNSPGTPDFQRVSVPLVVGTGIFIGLLFFGIMMIALRSLHNPAWMGGESYVGKIGTVKSFEGNIGQVQVGSELWTAEKDAASGNIGKGDKIEVVEIRGLRLIVRKNKIYLQGAAYTSPLRFKKDPMPATPTRDRVSPKTDSRPLRRPDWIKVRAPSGETYEWLHGLMRKKELHTVCEEAMCPNLGECWGSGTATFLMLGDVCTRTCAFCDIKHGKPALLDWGEAERVAQAVKAMELKHAVITSVNRDERRDGGAPIFAMVIRRIRELLPGCSIEVLIPDFKGSIEALKIVMDARPEILNHNVETVPRLFKSVQPQDNYEWAAATLSNAKKLDPEVLTKSGIMVGLGETMDEVKAVMRDQRSWGVDILTIGQYLQPSKKHMPMDRYYTMEEFAELREFGKEIGFKWVESNPLVRSSYHAAEQVRALSVVHRKLYGEVSVASE